MLRMPGKDVLPPGPKRDLVAELYVHYRLAARPPLPKIAALTGTESNPHKVSRETIRRLLTGTTTSQWAVVDALLIALCQLQDRDPDGRRWPEPEDSRWDENDPTTCREHLRRLWNDDIDGCRWLVRMMLTSRDCSLWCSDLAVFGERWIVPQTAGTRDLPWGNPVCRDSNSLN